MALNRRDFLKGFTIGGAAMLALDIGNLQRALAQLPAGALAAQPRDRFMHALNRLTFGVTPEWYERVQALGAEAFIEEQLAPETIDDSLTDAILADYPILTMPTSEILSAYLERRGQVVEALMAGTLVRMIYSQRSLYEMLVDFWSNHFNVYLNKGPTLFLKVADDRDVIRPHALGKFRDLLSASAHSPAMLFYLDNAQSSAEHPNENYARELMELHTLGVQGGYTENDVKEVARAFTGWSIVAPRDILDPDKGQFMFRQFIHDRQPKTVLGVTIDRGGAGDGEQVLELLAAHPATARFIATKLIRRFVSDTPPEALIERASQTFVQTDGDIKAVMRTIIFSDEFWNAPPKLKRPLEYFAGILRALAYQPGGNGAWRRIVRQILEGMGQIPFNWAAPNGYPDASAYWIKNLLPRWNLALTAVQVGRQGQPDYALLQQVAERSRRDGLDFLAHYLLGRALTSAETQAVGEFAGSYPTDLEKAQAAITLLMASPAYQYR